MRTSELTYDEESKEWKLREEGYDMAVRDFGEAFVRYAKEKLMYSDAQIGNALLDMFKDSDMDVAAWAPWMWSHKYITKAQMHSVMLKRENFLDN